MRHIYVVLIVVAGVVASQDTKDRVRDARLTIEEIEQGYEIDTETLEQLDHDLTQIEIEEN